MKKIHLLILVFVLIVLLGIVLYRLWLLSRKEGAVDSAPINTVLRNSEPRDTMRPFLNYWYSFNENTIDFRNNNIKLYNWGNQKWDAQIVQKKGQHDIKYINYGDIPGIQLNKANSQYIKLPEFNLDLSKGLTFTGIFKQTTGGWARLFDFGNGPGNENIGFSSKNGAFVFRGNSSNHSGLGSIPIDTWVKFAWTLDPKKKDPTKGVDSTKCIWTFYKDGVPSIPYDNQNYPNAVNRINNFIGQSNWSVDGTTDLSICEFRIYNTVLNKEYIKDLHNYPSLPSGNIPAPA